MTRATKSVLLDEVRSSANGGAPHELGVRYRPVLQGFARRLGLAENKIDAAVQETMDGFVDAYREGRLDGAPNMRAWLFPIAVDTIASASLSAIDALGSEAELKSIWRGEWRRMIIRRALDELYDSHADESVSLKAFELHTLEHRHVNEVASDLSMTRSAVFSAKNRLMGRLKAIFTRLDDEY